MISVRSGQGTGLPTRRPEAVQRCMESQIVSCNIIAAMFTGVDVCRVFTVTSEMQET